MDESTRWLIFFYIDNISLEKNMLMMRESRKKGKERKGNYRNSSHKEILRFFQVCQIEKKTSSNEKLSNFFTPKTLINQKLVF